MEGKANKVKPNATVDVSRNNSSGPNNQTDKVTVKVMNKKGAKSSNVININTADRKEAE